MPDRKRASRLRRTFGITDLQYTEMLCKQKGRCAICNRLPKHRRLAVDHDHKTGFVRGLLCAQCNQAIAKFRDATQLLFSAAEYLQTAESRFDQLHPDEQDAWAVFRGRATGKERQKRIQRSQPLPNLKV